jgi:hypothetical protein
MEMLNINNGSRNCEALCDRHYDAISDRIVHTLTFIVNRPKHSELHWKFRESLVKKETTLIQQSQNVHGNMLKFVNHLLSPSNNGLSSIIKCKPEDFSNIYTQLNNQFNFDEELQVGNKQVKVMHPLLESIFNYEHLSIGIKDSQGNEYSAFTLVDKIGINTCLYCNRQYITVIMKGEKRPPLDHFYPRSKYPIFGVSFYNLIPSCWQCNTSFKRDKDPEEENLLHPYKEGFSNDARFKYVPGSVEKTLLEIRPTPCPKRNAKLSGSSSLFEIEEVYKVHSDVSKELYNKSLKNSAEHTKDIVHILKKIGHITTTKEEFYQFYFGNYLKEEDFEKRPLAKFTADLVEELGIMKLYNQK